MMLRKGLLSRFMIIALLSVASCAKDDSDNPDCPKCPPPESPGKPDKPDDPGKPLPPPEEREETRICNLEWDLGEDGSGRKYQITYTIVKAKSNELHVSFKADYLKGSEKVGGSTFGKKYLPADPGYEHGLVNAFVWQARLIQSGAEIKNNALDETREASCKLL